MCLIAFAIGMSPTRPLMIAGNRDEFFDRPTAPLRRWTLAKNQHEVWSGRDLKDGGTWLGVDATGRLAMITNVRGAGEQRAKRSRGQLPLRWLQGDLDWPAMVASISAADYAGFNLVVGDFHRNVWGWVGNRSPLAPHEDAQPKLHHRLLSPGVYSLSNAVLDTPWPKTQRLAHAMRMSVEQSAFDAERTLTQALSDPGTAAASDLPRTGLPAEVERSLSSAFVHIPDRHYGTRSSLVLRVDSSGSATSSHWRVQMDEWTHAPPMDQNQPHRWSEQQRVSESLIW
ncbi:MAG TPA: NRDE family protein [Hydrogenophaga sp.]|nr:NRDE family protein [Hydrogenophaga sp.]